MPGSGSRRTPLWPRTILKKSPMRSSRWSVRSSGRTLTSRATSSPARTAKIPTPTANSSTNSTAPIQFPVGETIGVIGQNLQQCLLRFALLHLGCQLRENRQDISHHAQVSRREDRRMFVLVDRYNIFGTFHSGQVLNRATDSARDIEGWFDRLAGLSNLIAIGQPAGVHNCASRAGSAAQGRRQFLDQLIIFRFAQAAPAAHDDAGLFQCRSLACHLDAIKDFNALRGAIERNIQRLNLGA